VTAASAAEYPSKPIRLIVPSAAGGTPDIQARLIASELSKQMGQQVVIDNRGGASGIIGYEMIARAAPDGYTLGYAAFPFITNPIMYVKLPYDTAKDFQPVVRQVSGTNVLTVTPALPVQSVRDWSSTRARSRASSPTAVSAEAEASSYPSSYSRA